MIQQRRGMFKIWNLALAIIAYALSLFGTFLTRSGVLSSVHAFGESTLGPYFMIWIALILIVGFGLIFMRMPYLKGDNKLDSLLSRESSFLVNNILFFLAVAFMLWGTLAPLISQIFTGVKNEVTPDYFVRSVVPVLLGIIFLMGIGPLIAWRKASLDNITKSFWIPALVGFGSILIMFGLGMRSFIALLGLGVALFSITTVIIDYRRGIRTRQRHTQGKIAPAVQQMLQRNPSRYGGMLVHLGIALIAIVIVASSVFKVATVTVHSIDGKVADVDTHNGAAILQIGETFTVKDIHSYEARLDSVNAVGSDLKMTFTANFSIWKDGVQQPSIKVASELFLSNQMPNTVVYIGVDPLEDFYVSMPLNGVQPKRDAQGNSILNQAGLPTIGSAAFQVFVNPLMMWAWLGLVVTLIGLMVSIWPDPREALKPVPAWERASTTQPKEVVQV
jgi:cytochrome c-type biogenesis protein CcmF